MEKILVSQTDSEIVKIRYAISSSDEIAVLSACTSCYLSNEQEGSLAASISEIVVEFEIDKAWGFIKPISVNGYKVSHEI